MSTDWERFFRETEEERRRKALAAGLLGMQQSPFGQSWLSGQTKRKVFISYHHKDDDEVTNFVHKWTVNEKVFIPKGIGVTFSYDIINSSNPEYVMSQIRQKYLEDSSVTIVLLGSCTHSRRYVDWEIKSSLRQPLGSVPNGLIGIILPSLGTTAHLPPRFQDNWVEGHANCYARFYTAPGSADQLRGWIEDAYSARTTRSRLITNSSDMMKYNATCQVCGIIHPSGD